MTENKEYWDKLISEGLHLLQEQNNDAAAAVLSKASYDVEHSFHDSWRWGTDYWALFFYLKQSDYWDLGDKIEQIEKDIMSALVTFQKESRDLLSTVSIRLLDEEENDWEPILLFQKAVENAEHFISNGRYDSAFDRIHIAFSEYIKHILTENGVHFETDDSMSALLTKLHEHYCSHIQPSGAGDRIKTILLSTEGLIDTIGELRNNNTEAHPDGQLYGQLLEKRDAQLAVDLFKSIVDYIEDVEK